MSIDNKRDLQPNRAFDTPVKCLVYFCLALVGIVILWVAADTYVNICYKNKVLQRLDKIQYVTTDVCKSDDSTLVMTAKDIKDVLEVAIVEESTIMDSNNYLAIILTLITLCVSLSVVIPYIVGRSISAKTIKDTVDDIYTKDKHNSEVKYRKSVERLLLAEGHLSRITAYLLLNSAKNTYSSSLGGKYDEESHPYWALGWASKALIRYMKSYSQSKDEYNSSFVKDSVRYIVDASRAMSSQDISKNAAQKEKDKIIRSFVDIVDVIGFDEFYQGVLTVPQSNDIKAAAKRLYKVIKNIELSNKDLFKIACMKSKYEDYLTSNMAVTPTKDEYLSFLNKKINAFE